MTTGIMTGPAGRSVEAVCASKVAGDGPTGQALTIAIEQVENFINRVKSSTEHLQQRNDRLHGEAPPADDSRPEEAECENLLGILSVRHGRLERLLEGLEAQCARL